MKKKHNKENTHASHCLEIFFLFFFLFFFVLSKHNKSELLCYGCRIFESVNDDLNHSKVPSSKEFRNKPDGWETLSKGHDGNVWEMTQREEDILLQEFDRRIAYNKFQVHYDFLVSLLLPRFLERNFDIFLLMRD